MDKLDKVLEGLDCCTSLNFNLCDNGTCPYGPWNVILLCKHRLIRDAKELLKEYKAIKPLVDDISDQVHETAKMFRKDDEGVYE